MAGWTGPVFPSLIGVKYPIPRKINWDAAKQASLSGKNSRFSNRTYPTYTWSIDIEVLRTAAAFEELQTLVGFINSLQGPVGMFGYTDPDDNSQTSEVFGVGDGQSTSFQLVRAFGNFVEPIFLLNGTPIIDVSGSPVTPSSISPYGVVTFASAPASAAPLTWSGSFYWPCLFDGDSFDISQAMSGYYKASKLSFTSQKLP